MRLTKSLTIAASLALLAIFTGCITWQTGVLNDWYTTQIENEQVNYEVEYPADQLTLSVFREGECVTTNHTIVKKKKMWLKVFVLKTKTSKREKRGEPFACRKPITEPQVALQAGGEYVVLPKTSEDAKHAYFSIARTSVPAGLIGAASEEQLYLVVGTQRLPIANIVKDF
ncbi:MAG TPA: hypothetical protein PKW95_13185 [bacterium]|nr:hypothetical protein [bacterium]